MHIFLLLMKSFSICRLHIAWFTSSPKLSLESFPSSLLKLIYPRFLPSIVQFKRRSWISLLPPTPSPLCPLTLKEVFNGIILCLSASNDPWFNIGLSLQFLGWYTRPFLIYSPDTSMFTSVIQNLLSFTHGVKVLLFWELSVKVRKKYL